MAAFNWIVFDHKCPACGRSTRIRARTNMAADEDGDEAGAFSRRTYGLGERMAWFPPGDARFPAWISGGRRVGTTVQEACTCVCEGCRAPLCAVIGFRDVRATEVSYLARDSDWPSGFLR